MANLPISLARITCYLTSLVLLTAWDVLIVDNRRSPAEELVAYCRRRFAAFPHTRAESGVFQVGLSDFFEDLCLRGSTNFDGLMTIAGHGARRLVAGGGRKAERFGRHWQID